jgi:hypothetical protein
VSEQFEPREAQKTARSLDRVEQTEDTDDRFAIGGIALKQNKLFAGGVDLLAGFDEEIAKQVVHRCAKSPAKDKPRQRNYCAEWVKER